MTRREPTTLEVQRVLACEPAITVVNLEPDVDCVEVTVRVADRSWDLHVHAAWCAHGKRGRVPDNDRLHAWIGGNLTPIGALVDNRRTLTERLTPVRMYADLALPIGEHILCDERDHVVVVLSPDGRPYHGIVVDGLAADGTVGVLLKRGLRW